jgi:hypothetical protein
MNSSKWTWLFSLALVAAFAAPSFAEGKEGKKDWNKEHPRRHEVNKRLRNQNKRVKDGVEDGKLTKDQAQQIHKEDRNIRKEERRDAAKHGGHITKAEQNKINRQENRVSNQINKDEAGSKAAAPAAPAPAPAPAAGQ